MLKFKVDTGRLTFGDLLDMETGKLLTMAGVMARCMVDESDNYLPEAEALRQLRAIPINDLENAVKQFGEAMQSFKERAIPPTGGGKSS